MCQPRLLTRTAVVATKKRQAPCLNVLHFITREAYWSLLLSYAFAAWLNDSKPIGVILAAILVGLSGIAGSFYLAGIQNEGDHMTTGQAAITLAISKPHPVPQ